MKKNTQLQFLCKFFLLPTSMRGHNSCLKLQLTKVDSLSWSYYMYYQSLFKYLKVFNFSKILFNIIAKASSLLLLGTLNIILRYHSCAIERYVIHAMASFHNSRSYSPILSGQPKTLKESDFVWLSLQAFMSLQQYFRCLCQ